jgi:uncharacterized protein with PIN domain
VIVDTSALLAIVFQEPGYDRLIGTLVAADAVAAGTPTLAETAIVLSARLGADAHGMVKQLHLQWMGYIFDILQGGADER